MYTAIQSPQRWNSSVPLVCLLLLSLIFFTAMARVVISLIVVYLPSRNIDSVSTVNSDSKQAQFVLPANNPTKEFNTAQVFLATSSDDVVTGDISTISEYWGNLSPYADNTADYFGVHNVGLPDGCAVEQAFVLHRHGARYPAGNSYNDFSATMNRLQNTTGNYTGPMTFIKSWVNKLSHDDLLPQGVGMEYYSGVNFWKKYGRLLYNAPPGTNYYNATNQPILQHRCNNIQRVNDSAHSWAKGFYALYNQESKYTLLAIPAAPGFNNTLASFFSCTNFGLVNGSNGIFDTNEGIYIPVGNYLQPTVTRLKQYMPPDVNLTVDDAFVLQSLCTYEYFIFGQSDFCNLFTLNEWKGFSYTYDLYVYNGFSFGTPFGRALGLGVLQELTARLQNQTITVGNSSVNVTYDNNPTTFPLSQIFYLDMSHDYTIIGLLTAMSLDYFRSPLSNDAYPPDESHTFKTTHIIPYAARVITEKIGCASANPTEVQNASTIYTQTQYGYSATNAPNKFIRMRLNSGILPLSTIRGGYCASRTDGLCPLSNFLASHANASAEANYNQVCFGDFHYNSSKFTGDGNYFYP